MLVTSFSIQVFGGSIVDVEALKIASWSILGAALIFVSIAANTLFRGPIVFVEGSSLSDVLGIIRSVFGGVSPRAVVFAAFLTGFLSRLYPELKYIDMPIGWDILEHMSNARDFAFSPNFLTSSSYSVLNLLFKHKFL